MERWVLRYLGIVMDNIKTSYDVIRELKRMKIPFVLLRSEDHIPDHVSALIVCGSAPGVEDVRRVAYDGSPRSTVLKAMSASLGRVRFELAVVGVDPGESTGLAIIADGELVEAYSVRGSDLLEEVAELLATVPAERILFRIGKGKAVSGLADALKEDPRVKVEFVEETKKELPPLFHRKGLKKDARSALVIALSEKGSGSGGEGR
jgi:hypothetical protein